MTHIDTPPQAPENMEYGNAIDGAGRLVCANDFSSDTPYKNRPNDLKCLGCGEPVTLVLPRHSRISKHIRHKVTKICSKETYLHNCAKKILAEELQARVDQQLPVRLSGTLGAGVQKVDYLGRVMSIDFKETDHVLELKHMEFTLEKKSGRFIADVLGRSHGEDILFEIAVTHRCSEEKIASGQKIIEFDVISEECFDRLRAMIQSGFIHVGETGDPKQASVYTYGFESMSVDNLDPPDRSSMMSEFEVLFAKAALNLNAFHTDTQGPEYTVEYPFNLSIDARSVESPVFQRPLEAIETASHSSTSLSIDILVPDDVDEAVALMKQMMAGDISQCRTRIFPYWRAPWLLCDERIKNKEMSYHIMSILVSLALFDNRCRETLAYLIEAETLDGIERSVIEKRVSRNIGDICILNIDGQDMFSVYAGRDKPQLDAGDIPMIFMDISRHYHSSHRFQDNILWESLGDVMPEMNQRKIRVLHPPKAMVSVKISNENKKKGASESSQMSRTLIASVSKAGRLTLDKSKAFGAKVGEYQIPLGEPEIILYDRLSQGEIGNIKFCKTCTQCALHTFPKDLRKNKVWCLKKGEELYPSNGVDCPDRIYRNPGQIRQQRERIAAKPRSNNSEILMASRYQS